MSFPFNFGNLSNLGNIDISHFTITPIINAIKNPE
jgi:hypothetical protein